MGVLLSRYPDMNAKQVRELMFTTANNKMSDGVRFLGTGQTSPSGASTAWTAPDGLPDERWGWGIPDLAKGMHGPGQFLSPMTYNMNEDAPGRLVERHQPDRDQGKGKARSGVAGGLQAARHCLRW